MTLQTLYDHMFSLRLPAFRDGLREQQANPKCTELSFEDRLALPVDQECSQRRENRIRRNIYTANFPMQANLEDIDFPPPAAWTAALSWNLANATGSPATTTLWCSGLPPAEIVHCLRFRQCCCSQRLHRSISSDFAAASLPHL